FAPGGTTDILGRMMAEGLGKELGVTVIAENIAGANGNLGAQSVLRSKADGNTIMLGTPGPMIVNKYVYKNLAFDPKTAFAPVALVAELPNALMVSPKLGVNSVAELIGLAQKKKDGLTFGSPSVGSSGHVSTELFKLQAHISAVHVPYKGSSPMLVDLMSGNTDFTIDQISSALGFVQSGKLRALAVTSRTRSAQLPDVPTLREAGFPDYEVSVWFCVAAPAGTPQDRIDILNGALNKVLADPAVRERIASLGAQPLGGPPQDLARQILAEEKNIQAVTQVVTFEN
ncbi:tripartite tricarboxylate transporter substrate binding protein, partial [Bordetella hinzii]|nr:tripartite tricarboxylate transporter substrate binding protein [Bordetella hinzii]